MQVLYKGMSDVEGGREPESTTAEVSWYGRCNQNGLVSNVKGGVGSDIVSNKGRWASDVIGFNRGGRGD
jgi:hypothetical protein